MKRILSLILLLPAFVSVSAQLFRQDTAVRVGRLENGLTYYIRHNEEPKGLAYFYIAQKVGSIQEEPNQRGLAHFLEHMCFNGTTHFPGTSLRAYLERIGVKFGADLNAYTATDETVYNIDNVPVKTNGAVDSCLWILRDWSDGLTLAPKDIDEERGVIKEEWRMRNTPSQRMNEAMMPVIMKDSKYSDAMPIGNMDVVMNFQPRQLRDYYEKWYRPDLQAVVVTGDIDVDSIEMKIKKIFSGIPAAPRSAPKRIYYRIPPYSGPVMFAGRDKELTAPSAVIYFRHPALSRVNYNSREYFIDNLFAGYIYEMFHDRTRDIAQKPDSPFSLAYIRDGNFFLAHDDFALSAIVNCHRTKNGVMQGLKAFLEELFRVRQHGFTATEFDRYRKSTLVDIESALKKKDKRTSQNFADECVRNFLDSIPIVDIDEEVGFWKKELPRLTVSDLNQYFNSLFVSGENGIAISITAPDNDSIYIPTKKEIIDLYRQVEKTRTTPYVDVVNNLPFLPKEPVAGKITSETVTSDGCIDLTLSNGAKVKVMKTDFNKDEILIQALGKGGLSLLPPEMYKYGSLINMMTAVSGLGNYNLADMAKNFTGINATVNYGLADNYQSVAGNCSPKDLKYLLEMIHAAFLYPHKDTDAFKALCQRLKRSITEMQGKPEQVYADSLSKTLYGVSTYTQDLKPENLDNVDFDKLLDLYRQSFDDASKFTFTVVGNVDIDSLRPYVEKYIASLPSTYKDENARPVKMILPGSRTCRFEKTQETPKARISIYYTVPSKFSLRERILSSILGQVLTIKYTKTIREDAGAAYSVSAYCSAEDYPEESSKLVVSFTTNPDQCDIAVNLVYKGLDELIDKGPSEEDVDKAKQYLLKVSQSNRNVNKYWQYVMSYEWNHGETYDKNYDSTVREINVNDIRHLAKLLRNGNCISVIMSSPKKNEGTEQLKPVKD